MLERDPIETPGAKRERPKKAVEAEAASAEAVAPPPPAGGGTFTSAPPPPTGWTWPFEGECIEVEVEGSDESPPAWIPSRVLQVLIDGQFQARIELPDGSDAWDDWFSWQDEGTDWRRKAAGTKGKRRKGAKGAKGAAAKAVPRAAPRAAPPPDPEGAVLQQAVLRLASVRPAEATAAYTSLLAEERLALLLALMRAACDTQEAIYHYAMALFTMALLTRLRLTVLHRRQAARRRSGSSAAWRSPRSSRVQSATRSGQPSSRANPNPHPNPTPTPTLNPKPNP